VSNAGKESNKLVEVQTKSVHNSLHVEVTDEETVVNDRRQEVENRVFYSV